MNPNIDRKRGGILALLTAALLVVLSGCTPQVLLVVTITSPNAAVITNGAVTVQLAIEGGTPSGVSLLLDGALLVDLSAPYTYTWDTAGTAEADYQLTARATLGGTGFDSDPLVVTVDRTPPTVTARTPTPGSGAVWLGEEIRVAFSEPLAAATLTDTTVELLESASPLAKTLTLDPDIGALTMTLDQTPALPATLTAALSPSITDRAGNALALPAGAWSWGVEAYALYGGALDGLTDGQVASVPSLAFGTDGLPVVSWGESDGSVMRVFVRRWDGDTWQLLGEPLSNDPTTDFIFTTSLAVDGSGAPIVIWDEIDNIALTGTVHARRWDGSAWQPLGSGVTGFLPSLAIDSDDRPTVASLTPNGTVADLAVHRWDGAAWGPLGSTLSANPGDTNAGKPALAVDGTQPLVAWAESDGVEERIYVRRWDGAAWQPLGGAIDAVANEQPGLPSLATDQNGTPVIAFREDSADTKIFAFRWNGAAWSQLGAAFDSGAGDVAGSASVSIGTDDKPVVAWLEFGASPEGVYAARFEGGGWSAISTVSSAIPGDTNISILSAALSPADEPWIAWLEEGDLYVQGPNALP
jgi:hypothetical protein